MKKISGASVPVYVCREGLANEYTADNSRMLAELEDFSFTSMEQAVNDLLDYYNSISEQVTLMDLLY